MLMHSKMPEAMKHSKGGMCKMCGGGQCQYAKGGSVGAWEDEHEEGVNKLTDAKGVSERGEHVRSAHSLHDEDEGREKEYRRAKHLAEENLDKLKMMKKPNLKGLAHGGEVEGAQGTSIYSDDNVKGVNRPRDKHNPRSESEATRMDRSRGEKSFEYRKETSKQNIENLKNIHPKLKGLSKGGDVHEDEAQDKDLIHDELSGMLGEELMSALDQKDHKRIIENVEAIVMNCLSKMSGE